MFLLSLQSLVLLVLYNSYTTFSIFLCNFQCYWFYRIAKLSLQFTCFKDIPGKIWQVNPCSPFLQAMLCTNKSFMSGTMLAIWRPCCKYMIGVNWVQHLLTFICCSVQVLPATYGRNRILMDRTLQAGRKTFVSSTQYIHICDTAWHGPLYIWHFFRSDIRNLQAETVSP